MSSTATDPTHLDRVVPWFIALRWTACGGVIAALATVGLGLRYPLPYRPIVALTAALLAVNALYTAYFVALRKRSLTPSQASLFLSVQVWSDYALLFSLVYLSGFLENPFSYYFVFHVMLSAYLFRPRRVALHVGALLAAFCAVLVLGGLGWIPTFTLTQGLLPAGQGGVYWAGRIPQAIGLGSTLVIAAYLTLSIKQRLEEKGKWVEVELDRYKELDRIKSNFILQVTHELRGPLAAANGYHEMVLRGITGAIADKTRDAVVKATRRVDNLLTIIDEMIDYAYMSTQTQGRYEPSSLAVREVMDHAIEAFSVQAQAKEISFECLCAGEPRLFASRDLVNIILGNLVSNAVRYSPRGSKVTITAAEEGDEVHLTVRDRGIGIEAGELDRIFEEFYRTRRARELEKDGTGLGLVITQRAVEHLRGRIRIYSEVDRGTEFHVYLPKGGANG